MCNTKLDQFVKTYITTLLLIDCEELPTPSSEEDGYSLSHESKLKVKNDCLQFINQVLAEYPDAPVYNEIYAYDFYLTRNGHGAGFWVRPELYGKTEATRLTKIASTFTTCDIYLDDDNLISIFP